MGRPGNCIPRHIWGFYQKVQRGYKSFYRINHCHRSCDVLSMRFGLYLSDLLLYHPLSRHSKYCHIPQLKFIANSTHPPIPPSIPMPPLSFPLTPSLYTHTNLPQRQKSLIHQPPKKHPAAHQLHISHHHVLWLSQHQSCRFIIMKKIGVNTSTAITTSTSTTSSCLEEGRRVH